MAITIIEKWREGTFKDLTEVPLGLPDYVKEKMNGWVVVSSSSGWYIEKSFPQDILIWPEKSFLINTPAKIFVCGVKSKYPGYESYGVPGFKVFDNEKHFEVVNTIVTFVPSFSLGKWEEFPENYFTQSNMTNLSGGRFELNASTVGIYYRPTWTFTPQSLSLSLMNIPNINDPNRFGVFFDVLFVPTTGGEITFTQGNLKKSIKVTNFNNRPCFLLVSDFVLTEIDGDYGSGYIYVSSYNGWMCAITSAQIGQSKGFMNASPTIVEKVINSTGDDLVLIKTKVILTKIPKNQENYIRFINKSNTFAVRDTVNCQRVVLCNVSSIITPEVTPTPSKTPQPSKTSQPSKTPSNSIRVTPSVTPSITATSTKTKTPYPSNSKTPSVSPSVTPSNTPSNSLTPTPYITPSVTPSNTPSNSLTPTPTQTLELSPTPTPSNTAGVSPTPTPSQTPTITQSVTPSNNSFITLTPTPSLTISISVTPSITPTKSKRPSVTSKPNLLLPTPTPTAQKKVLNYNPQIISSLFLKTSKEYISPFIDTKRLSYTLIHNNINKLVTIQDQDLELNPKGGIAKSRYITKPVKLNSDTPASRLFISFSANIPKKCLIRLYYRVYNTIEDPENFITSKNWNFVAHSGTRNTHSDDQFLDFEYQIDEIVYTNNSSLKEFDMFSIKIILESESDSIVPKVKDFRVIALS